jgi:hypothetical protein
LCRCVFVRYKNSKRSARLQTLLSLRLCAPFLTLCRCAVARHLRSKRSARLQTLRLCVFARLSSLRLCTPARHLRSKRSARLQTLLSLRLCAPFLTLCRCALSSLRLCASARHLRSKRSACLCAKPLFKIPTR